MAPGRVLVADASEDFVEMSLDVPPPDMRRSKLRAIRAGITGRNYDDELGNAEANHSQLGSAGVPDDTPETVGRRAGLRKVSIDVRGDTSLDGDGSDDDSGRTKRRRLTWTRELHNLFLSALRQLGMAKAVPKAILKVMNVPGMTRENVASHLQKYRAWLKKAHGQSTSAFFADEVPQISHPEDLDADSAAVTVDAWGGVAPLNILSRPSGAKKQRPSPAVRASGRPARGTRGSRACGADSNGRPASHGTPASRGGDDGSAGWGADEGRGGTLLDLCEAVTREEEKEGVGGRGGAAAEAAEEAGAARGQGVSQWGQGWHAWGHEAAAHAARDGAGGVGPGWAVAAALASRGHGGGMGMGVGMGMGMGMGPSMVPPGVPPHFAHPWGPPHPGGWAAHYAATAAAAAAHGSEQATEQAVKSHSNAASGASSRGEGASAGGQGRRHSSSGEHVDGSAPAPAAPADPAAADDASLHAPPPSSAPDPDSSRLHRHVTYLGHVMHAPHAPHAFHPVKSEAAAAFHAAMERAPVYGGMVPMMGYHPAHAHGHGHGHPLMGYGVSAPHFHPFANAHVPEGPEGGLHSLVPRSIDGAALAGVRQQVPGAG